MGVHLRERIIDALQTKWLILPSEDLEAAAEIAASFKLSDNKLMGMDLLKAVSLWLDNQPESKLSAHALSLKVALVDCNSRFAPTSTLDSASDSSSVTDSSMDSSLENDDDDDDDDDNIDIEADVSEEHQASCNKDAKKARFEENKNYGGADCDTSLTSADEDEDEDQDDEEEDDNEEEEEFVESEDDQQTTAAWLELWSNARAKARMHLSQDEAGSYVVRLEDEAQSLSARLNGRNLQVTGVLLPSKADRAGLLQEAHQWHSQLSYRERHFVSPEELLLRLGKGRYGRVEETIALPADANTARATASHARSALHITVPKRAPRKPAFQQRPMRHAQQQRRAPFYAGHQPADRRMMGRNIFANNHRPFDPFFSHMVEW
jgi:hypothetical protein